MMKIKLYGTGTPTYQLTKSKLSESLNSASIAFEMEEINDISIFIKDMVVSVPAIKVDDQLYELKPNGGFNRSLRDSIQAILKYRNYGSLVQIIVPTDFSEPSFNAYSYANKLAKELKGILQLSHVYFPTSTDINQFAVVDEQSELHHREKLNNYVNSVNQDWIGNFVSEPLIHGEFKVGFPKSELIEMSKIENAIMVIGTTGSGDGFKKIFGSLSLDLIDSVHCPLFLIPPNVSYSTSEQITYLSENLKNDSIHLLYVAKLCKQLHASLKIIHFKKDSNDNYNINETIELIQKYHPDLVCNIETPESKDIFESIKEVVNYPKNNIVAMSTKHRNIFQNIFHKSATEFAALNSNLALLVLTDYCKCDVIN